MITFSGKVLTAASIGTGTPVSGATVTGLSTAGASLGSVMTAADGTYSLTLPTGGVPLDVHLSASKAGRIDTHWYPATARYANETGVDLNSFDSTTLGLLGLAAGSNPSNMRSQVFLAVYDCADHAISGATVSSNPAASVTRYIANGVPSNSATATDSDGAAFLGNVPVGNITLGGAYMGTMMRPRVISSQAGIVIQATVEP